MITMYNEYNTTMSTIHNEDYEYNVTMSTMHNEKNVIQCHNEYNVQ